MVRVFSAGLPRPFHGGCSLMGLNNEPVVRFGKWFAGRMTDDTAVRGSSAQIKRFLDKRDLTARGPANATLASVAIPPIAFHVRGAACSSGRQAGGSL